MQEDTFTLRLPEVGTLTKLVVRSDNAGQGPAWHLNKVIIIPPYPPASVSPGINSTSGSVAKQASRAQLIVPAASATPMSPRAGPHGGVATGGQPVFFIADRWIDAVHGLEVVLDAHYTDPAKDLTEYVVKVITSDVK